MSGESVDEFLDKISTVSDLVQSLKSEGDAAVAKVDSFLSMTRLVLNSIAV